MEPTSDLVPPVVAVMVVNDPGPWFADVLVGLAGQDYANLKCLFLVTGDPGEIPAQVRALVPNSFVRAVEGVNGFGQTANEVLRLVEGDNGFFCFMHDDVALEPSAIRLLVEELYRSNAGIVGPKLVEWNRPNVLQHVGYGVDRFGAFDPIVEPGEVDQEQHDAVRDVFTLPSACMLVRADLFRAVDGFEPSIDFHGDDLDLCWRVHLSGARVVVVPAAVARHVESLPARRPDLHHAAHQTRHRMRTVLTLTGARRLPLLVLQLIVVTLAETLISVLTGRFRQAASLIGGLVGLVPRLPSIIARRRQIAPLRHVPDNEIAGLQQRGSARLTSYLRSRDSRPAEPDAVNERRWRQAAGSAPAIAWLCVLLGIALGSRHLITGGVPGFGQFLAFPDSPRQLLGDYRSGWWGHGLGSSDPAPTGIALVGIGSVLALFNMGLWHTMCVVGLLVVGALGMWRLATIFPAPRARITALVVYAALPLPSQLISVGRWSALAVYAASPWVVHLIRRLAALDTVDSLDDSVGERFGAVPMRRRIRWASQLALLSAVTLAFAPGFMVVLVGIGAFLALGTVISRGTIRAAAWMAGAGLAAAVAAIVANLPWSRTLFGDGAWDGVVGVPEVTSTSLGVSTLARFGVGRGTFDVLAIALYGAMLVGLLVARSWRLTWSIRAASLVVGFGWLIVLDDRGSLPIRLPEAGMLLAPVAVGLAVSAACLVAAVEDDVLRGSFGWRQPLGLLGVVLIAVGLIPGAYAIGDGRWNTPTFTLTEVLGQLPTDPAEGDYRILWIGDPAVMPVAPFTLRPGLAYAITDDGPLLVNDAWAGQPSDAEQQLVDVIDQVAQQTTLRAGRLMAPFAIRYIVVPIADGAVSTVNNPLPLPAGLIDALDDQLDLAKPLTRPLNYVVYENTAWVPTRSQLSPSAADASRRAGAESLAQADLSGSVPVAVGMSDRGSADFAVDAGVVHLAIPFDNGWTLSVDGVDVPQRPAFGATTAYDIATPGSATLRFETPFSRSLSVGGQAVVWLLLLLAASRFDPVRTWNRVRPRGSARPVEPVMALSLHDPILSPSGTVPWLDDDDADGEENDADLADALDVDSSAELEPNEAVDALLARDEEDKP